jgi:hypothetical protein
LIAPFDELAWSLKNWLQVIDAVATALFGTLKLDAGKFCDELIEHAEGIVPFAVTVTVSARAGAAPAIAVNVAKAHANARENNRVRTFIGRYCPQADSPPGDSVNER